jgi:hypothetical protein
LVSNSQKNPLTAFTLSFGNKKVLGKDIFVGLGSGFLMVSNAEVKLVPVYLKVHATTNKNRTSAFWGMESGYSFSINNNYKGGVFTNLSAGMSYKVNYKSSLYLGLIGGVYSVSGNLTESTANGIYAYFGNTTIKMYGLKLGIQF